MKIYLIKTNNDIGYDEYDSIVIIAKSKWHAEEIAVKKYGLTNLDTKEIGLVNVGSKSGCILASFNAG